MDFTVFRPENFQRNDIDVVWELADGFAEWFVLAGGEVMDEKQYCEVVQHHMLGDLDYYVGIPVLTPYGQMAVELGVLIDGHPTFEADACKALLAGVESSINDDSIIIEYPRHEADGLWVIAHFTHDQCTDHGVLDRRLTRVADIAQAVHEALH